MLRRTESYAGKAQRNIAAPYQQKKVLSAIDESNDVGALKNPSASDFVDHSNFRFKPLDDMSTISFKDYCGPTPESNWVIPGVLLVGAYPASQDDEETYELITSILKEGITKFVCLQQEYRDEGVTVEMWRSGNALRPYFHDVRMVVHNKAMFPDLQGFNIVDKENLSFVHFPIRDCGITDDERVLELSRTLVKAISEGEVIYLHCWGGHGRTGTLVCIMLHLMYSLDSVEAMSRCQWVHDLRMCPVIVGSPQTQTQRDQVTRVIRRLMTQTHFHRRTLSDLFNHTGAARLSMLTEHSPRSEAAHREPSPSSPFHALGTNPNMFAQDSFAEELHRSSSADDDEGEEVVAMGYSCLDDDDFIEDHSPSAPPTPSSMSASLLASIVIAPQSRQSAPSSVPPSVLSSILSSVVVHRSVISVAALSPSDGNADSYIDSDVNITDNDSDDYSAGTCAAGGGGVGGGVEVGAGTRTPTKTQYTQGAPSSSPSSSQSPPSVPQGVGGLTVLSVFSPASLVERDRHLNGVTGVSGVSNVSGGRGAREREEREREESEETYTDKHTCSPHTPFSSPYTPFAPSTSSVEYMDVEVSLDAGEIGTHSNAHSNAHSNSVNASNGSSGMSVDLEGGMSDDTDMECDRQEQGQGQTPLAPLRSPLDSSAGNRVKGQSQDLSPATPSLADTPHTQHGSHTPHGSESLSEKSSDTRSSSGTGTETRHPVPIPPPASARPSSGAAAASGVLAGLRNFRMQWGSGSNINSNSPSSNSNSSSGSSAVKYPSSPIPSSSTPSSPTPSTHSPISPVVRASSASGVSGEKGRDSLPGADTDTGRAAL